MCADPLQRVLHPGMWGKGCAEDIAQPPSIDFLSGFFLFVFWKYEMDEF